MDGKIFYKIFPYIKDRKKLLKLKIDEDSVSFISHKDVASKISSIIISYLKLINVTADDVFITDATAGVGGNTISFCLNFGFCTAIEMDQKRCDYLNNNLELYDLKNYKTICGDCTEQLTKVGQHDVVFLDPPWGGKNYKKFKNLKLTLSDIPIEKIIDDLLSSNLYLSNPKIVVIKLPLNYDICHFYSSLKTYSIFIHKLRKMYILIILKNKVFPTSIQTDINTLTEISGDR